jgi:hypothetical protein
MRAYVILALISFAVALSSCGGGSSRKLEESFPTGQSPMAKNDAGVQVTINHYKQSDHYLIVNLTITNGTPAPITLHTGQGSNFDGFRASLEGQTFIAIRGGGGWNPWTGYHPANNGPAGDIDVPAGISISSEVRFDFKVSKKDYDWMLTVTNVTAGGKVLPDLSISYPAVPTGK